MDVRTAKESADLLKDDVRGIVEAFENYERAGFLNLDSVKASALDALQRAVALQSALAAQEARARRTQGDCGPAHYEGDGVTTCAVAMKSMTSEVDHDPMVFWWWLCAFKYLWRWPHKGRVDDLRKCEDCVHRLIEVMEDSEIRRYDP